MAKRLKCLTKEEFNEIMTCFICVYKTYKCNIICVLPCNKDKVTRGKPEKGMDFCIFTKRKYPIPTPKGGTTLGRSTTVNIWYDSKSHELPARGGP